MESKEQQIKPARKFNSYFVSFKILFIFGVPALFGGMAARKVDEYFGTFPLITIGVMIMLYVISWIFVLKTINSFIKVK